MNCTELRQRVERTANLPSLPAVVCKIIAAVDDPNACVNRLNELIVQEPALATRMLRLANSAYFGRRNGIVSLPQCALVLGFNTIRSLALSASVQRTILSSGVRSFDPTAFWRHSLGVGVSARVMARHAGGDAEAAMAAGLVHDIGRLVLDLAVPSEYEQVLARVRKGEPEPKVEREVLGASHAEVGGWLALKWKLPEAIVAAISWHDKPESAGAHRPLAALVMLADEVTRALAEERPAASVDAGIWRDAETPYADAEGIGSECLREWQRTEEVMGALASEARAA